MTISSEIIIVLPLTFVLEPDISIALLLGLYVGGMLGGSFSAQNVLEVHQADVRITNSRFEFNA